MRTSFSFTIYSRVLGLLRPVRGLAVILTLANLALAAVPFQDPILFGKAINLLTNAAAREAEAYKSMGVEPSKQTCQKMRSAVCAQCHVTYNIPKDKENKSIGLYFPWQNSKFITAMLAGENGKKKTRMNGYPVSWNQMHHQKNAGRIGQG